MKRVRYASWTSSRMWMSGDFPVVICSIPVCVCVRAWSSVLISPLSLLVVDCIDQWLQRSVLCPMCKVDARSDPVPINLPTASPTPAAPVPTSNSNGIAGTPPQYPLMGILVDNPVAPVSGPGFLRPDLGFPPPDFPPDFGGPRFVRPDGGVVDPNDESDESEPVPSSARSTVRPGSVGVIRPPNVPSPVSTPPNV